MLSIQAAIIPESGTQQRFHLFVGCAVMQPCDFRADERGYSAGSGIDTCSPAVVIAERVIVRGNPQRQIRQGARER